MMIVNLDGKIGMCSNFTWREALYLPSVDVYVFPSTDTVKNNILLIAMVMEEIRALLGVPLKVTSWLRPSFYNKLVRGSKRSEHIKGAAVDFVPMGLSVTMAREMLLPHLKRLGIRMENNKGLWIHIDTKMIGEDDNRFFLP